MCQFETSDLGSSRMKRSFNRKKCLFDGEMERKRLFGGKKCSVDVETETKSKTRRTSDN